MHVCTGISDAQKGSALPWLVCGSLVIVFVLMCTIILYAKYNAPETTNEAVASVHVCGSEFDLTITPTAPVEAEEMKEQPPSYSSLFPEA